MKTLLFFTVFLSILSCNKSEKMEEEVGVKKYKQLIDSADNYIITAKYPISVQDTANEVKKLVDIIISNEKEDWQNTSSKKNKKLHVNIDYEEFNSQKYATTSYLLKVSSKIGNKIESNNAWTIVFRNRKTVDIEYFLNDFKDDSDLQITKLLSREAIRQNDKINKTLLDDGLGLSFLETDGQTLDREKFDGDGFFFGANLQNFIVENSGISFYFNEGEIAPESEGIQKISLTWEQLSPYLRK